MEHDRYYVAYSGSFLDFQIDKHDFSMERSNGDLVVKRNIAPKCPRCGSYEVDGERPLWDGRELEGVEVSFYCNACNEWFTMTAVVIFTGYRD